jgi:hypothetical protein
MKICPGCSHRFDTPGWSCPACTGAPVSVSGFTSFLHEEDDGQGGFDARYFPELYRLEEGHFWFRHRTGIILKAIGPVFTDAQSVLEVGCGTGVVLAAIRRAFPEWSVRIRPLRTGLTIGPGPGSRCRVLSDGCLRMASRRDST